MEMVGSNFPVVTMARGDVSYNELHGYVNPQDLRYMNETLTILGDSRETGYHIDTYGKNIDSIRIEVRNISGSRLIEEREIKDFSLTGWSIDGELIIKDLIDKDTEYSLMIALTFDEKEVYYYTRILWSDETYIDEKLGFVQEFHDKLFDKSSVGDIKKYLETNSSLNKNNTFALVDIHSSFEQVSYGELAPSQLEEPTIYLKDISSTMATVLMEYILFTGPSDNRVYYRATEYYRVRLGKERFYLIDYERKMEQIPEKSKLCQNDKVVLGITDTNVDYEESEDGQTVAFITSGKLYSYQSASNKLTEVFAFFGNDDFDKRAMYDAHSIKILNIDEAGTIEFAVYGYMNSGRHEGEVGIEVYRFDGGLNTIEELVYIPYDKSYGMLEAELSRLFYLNNSQHLYLTLENKVYCIDLENRTYTVNSDVENDDTLVTSRDHRVLISTRLYDGRSYARSLILTNLETEIEVEIKAEDGDAIKPLGFVGEDVLYGIAHISDMRMDMYGRIYFPMYRIVICDEEGNLIKKYEHDGYYVTELSLEDNQLTLERVTMTANGTLVEANPDYIVTESVGAPKRTTDATTVVDIYETYVQLLLPKTVDSASLKITDPKEIVYEGGRELILELEDADRYFVYDAYGLEGIFNLASNAVESASEKAGWVYDSAGNLLWKKVNRKTKNQIMAIAEESVSDDRNSLAVCLDAMLKYEGIIRNSNYLLEMDNSVMEILNDSLEGYKVLDLKDCALDDVLYYINMDIPVLVLTGMDSAVLLVGYNDSAVVVLQPLTGKLEKVSMDEAVTWFEKTGNEFIVYVKTDAG